MNRHSLREQMGQLVDRERVLIGENDQLRAQLVEMKEQEKKKYDDLMVQYNMKREYEDDGLDKQGTAANQVTVKTESDDEDVKQEIKVEIKEEDDEEDRGIFIKQEFVSAYIKTESSDVKLEIKEEIKVEGEDNHDDDCGFDLRLVKKELVSDDDDNSMQIDDPVNEVVQPNLNLSRDQLITPTNFELSPSANCQMQLTNSSQIEQSVDQQVDKADHEPNEPDNHGHNQWPTTKQSQSRTRKRTAMTSGQVSMNGPMTNSKRTRVETELDRPETVELSTGSRVDLMDDLIRGGGEGLGQIDDDDNETELGEEDQGGHYKIETVKLKCTEDGCEDEVANREELHDHLRVIHHISPHRCLAVGCNERFEQWGELGNHVKHNHSNTSNWKCAHCTKTFKSHNILYVHLHFYHFEGQFKCGYDGCHYDRVATLRVEIKHHQYSVHPKTINPTIYICPLDNCGKSFNHKGNFNIHQLIHTGVKPFGCEWNDCGMSFTRKGDLNVHQRIHQMVKPFKCTWNICDYASTKQSDVIRHIRMKHFHLPRSLKEQRQLGIDDNRDPRDYLQQEYNN